MDKQTADDRMRRDLQFFYGKWRKKETHERDMKMNYTARHYAEILDDLQKMFNLDDVGD